MTAPFVDLGPGPTLLARAVVPDPCCWSPDLPAIYDVTVELLQDAHVVSSVRREIGLKALGVRGRHLALESRRWVLRGVWTSSSTSPLPRQWREGSAAWVAADAEDTALQEASQFGALAVADVRGSADEMLAGLRRLTQFPASAIAIVRGELPADFQRASAAPNLLLAQPLGREGPQALPPWVQLLWADDPLVLAQRPANHELPIIACRKLAEPVPLAAARAACDALQRDLAPRGQFAGYVV